MPERDLRNGTLAHAEAELTSLAHLATQHSEDTFQLADNVLVGFRRLIEDPDMAQHARAAIRSLLDGEETRSRLRRLSVIDGAGGCLAGFCMENPSGSSVSERGNFQLSRQSTNRGLRIGGLQRDPTNGRQFIELSRRVEDANGGFAGVAVAEIDLDQLVSPFASATLPEDTAVSLFTVDGKLLIRHPAATSHLGEKFERPPGIDADTARRPSFTFHIVSPIDGLSRTGVVHRGERFPILAVVARTDDGILQPWWSVAWWRTAVRGGLALLFFTLGLAVVRQIARRQMTSNALLRREREFRVLAEGSGDAVLRMGLTGNIDYASPAALEVTGLEPAELQGTSLASLCDPAEKDAVLAALRDAVTGRTTRVSFFTVGEDGQRRYVSATLHASGDEDDRTLIGVLRDDTDGYAMERRLMSLATTDALTGLANRHVFAEQYDREWRRAVRESSALSLLFIDADRFKKFNDHYGHPKGDACLRDIGRVISKTVRRPGDLPVRYGGEEFLLLLPNTDGAGAQRVAEQLRFAIEALAIPHAKNDRFGVMTVSIGIATTRPGAGRWLQPTLLEMADQALYEAKAGGRNCIRASSDDLDPMDIEFRAVDPTAH